jgi:hypothetical protein
VIGHDVEELVARFVDATNTTVLGRAGGELVVYKPLRGNRPLWDFDVTTLPQREVFAYRVAVALGFGVVPETVLGRGPLGPGAVQRYVEADASFDPVPLVQRADPALWPIAVLDLVINNADRKLGHILAGRDGRLWAIDHGLAFHHDDKLRTVLWCFAGRELPRAMVEALNGLTATLEDGLRAEVAGALGDRVAAALQRRVGALLEDPVHPAPPDDRPPLPWPVY